MEEKLTPRQAEIFKYIKEHIKEHGFPPTIRDIGKSFNIKSTNGVNVHLRELIRKGYIKKMPYRSRSIAVLTHTPEENKQNETVKVSLIGVVKAGKPIFAYENLSETLIIDKTLVSEKGEVFCLKVSGDSMIGDGIFDGDFIFVRKQEYANNGDIVVAMIGEEATVKKFLKDNTKIVLKSSNPKIKSIELFGEKIKQLRIIGKVIGVFRRY